MTVAAIAAVAAAARRRVVTSLQDQDAFSPATAGQVDLHRGLDRRMLGRLIRSGVVIQAAPDSYYLDRDALQASTERRRRIKRVVLGGAFLTGAAALLARLL